MVVMDRQEYINKSNNLLTQPAYRPIPKDPPNKIKAKLISILRRVMKVTGLNYKTYKYMYLWDARCPDSLDSQRFTSWTPPLGLVSNTGLVTYGVAKVLTKILTPLVATFPHNIHSFQDFVEQAHKVTLLPGEYLSSYDVTDLFTSVPIEQALGIIKDLLEQDNTLKARTVLPVKDIILLLDFCLHNTYFSFQGQFYEQVKGAAMGSLVSPIVANLCMECFEQKTLSIASHPLGCVLGMWMTHLSSKRKITNKASLNTLIVLT